MSSFEVVEAETKQVVLPQKPASVIMDLIRFSIENDKGVEALERIIAMKNAEDERNAKADFDRQFALMQSELRPVVKNKSAQSDGKKMYSYAPLEELQRVNGDVIAKHGFSYSWIESNTETGRRYTIVISGHGHSKEFSFDIPLIQGTKFMNAAQVAASMSTYGRRYSFLLGFGIQVCDEDDDAQSLTFENGLKYAGLIEKIKLASDVDVLKKVYLISLDMLQKDDTEGRNILARVKNEKYMELRK